MSIILLESTYHYSEIIQTTSIYSFTKGSQTIGNPKELHLKLHISSGVSLEHLRHFICSHFVYLKVSRLNINHIWISWVNLLVLLPQSFIVPTSVLQYPREIRCHSLFMPFTEPLEFDVWTDVHWDNELALSKKKLLHLSRLSHSQKGTRDKSSSLIPTQRPCTTLWLIHSVIASLRVKHSFLSSYSNLLWQHRHFGDVLI